MSATLGQLLAESFQSFRARIRAYLLGALLFGILLAVIRGSFVEKTVQVMPQLPENVQEGIDVKFNEERDTDASADPFILNQDEQEILALFIAFLPLFTLTFLASCMIVLLSAVYFLLVALHDEKANKEPIIVSALHRLPRWVLPFAGLWIWIILRSFVWIPVFGWIIAVYMLPRLALSPVIMIKERHGIVESARLSVQRSDGYWGKIFGNLFVVSLCTGIIANVWFEIVSVLSGVMLSVYLLFLLESVVAMFLTAFSTVFLVKLFETITKHPRVIV